MATRRKMSRHALAGSERSSSSPDPTSRRQISFASVEANNSLSSGRTLSLFASSSAPSLTSPTPTPSRTYSRIVAQPPISKAMSSLLSNPRVRNTSSRSLRTPASGSGRIRGNKQNASGATPAFGSALSFDSHFAQRRRRVRDGRSRVAQRGAAGERSQVCSVRRA